MGSGWVGDRLSLDSFRTGQCHKLYGWYLITFAGRLSTRALWENGFSESSTDFNVIWYHGGKVGMTCGESTYLAEEWNYGSLLMVSFTGHSALCVFLRRCKGRKIPQFFAMHRCMERCLESLASARAMSSMSGEKGTLLKY